ncbi:MAG: zinc metallopeptidase [Atopobiaceae bacterium]|nr:zinc metallopeptidase [Atopobiaceae bacterium]
MFYDGGYLLIVLISLALGGITQAYIKSTYNKWSKVPSHVGATGATVARRMLDEGGAGNVGITSVAGTLTDYFDPRDNNLHLSNDNYQGASVASLAVACHEAGHAVQTAKGYVPGKLRTALVPVVNFSQQMWMIVFLAGMVLGLMGLVQFSIVLFAFTVLFQIVTLPVEIDASRRAVRYLDGCLPADEVAGARQVLTAAALTYVASALVSVLNLLYLLARSDRR